MDRLLESKMAMAAVDRVNDLKTWMPEATTDLEVANVEKLADQLFIVDALETEATRLEAALRPAYAKIYREIAQRFLARAQAAVEDFAAGDRSEKLSEDRRLTSQSEAA